jgi:hypothetical protein
MKAIQRTTLACTLVLVLVAIPTALAFAKEVGSVTITGPGIDGEATIDDPQGVLQLQQMGFFDTSNLAKLPTNLGQGYRLTAYMNMDEKTVPFVQTVYYPAPAGQNSYMHFVGAYDGNTMQFTKTDRWGVVKPAAAALFARLARAQGLALEDAVSSQVAKAPVAPAAAAPAAQPQAASAPVAHQTRPDMQPMLTMSAALLLVAAALFAWRRRTLNHR